MTKQRCDHAHSAQLTSRASCLLSTRNSARPGARPSTPPMALRPADDPAATRLEVASQARALGVDPALVEAATGAVWRAWEAVPEHTFTGSTRREQLAALVRGGWFARLVQACAEGAGTDAAVARMLIDPRLARLKNFREVAMRWAAPLRVARAPYAPATCAEEAPDDDSPDGLWAPQRAGIFERVERQKAAIVQLMDRRDEVRASDYAAQLVAMQLRTRGGPKHAVRTLCDLAKKADARGLHALQLQLTGRAVEVLPEDGWAWQQHAVALRRVGRHEESGDAARRSTRHRQDAASHNALASSFRSAGRLPEALAIYEETVRLYPGSSWAFIGRAEVLKVMGRLDEALTAYEAGARAHPDRGILMGGRAETLKAMGRLDEALAAYDEAMYAHADEVCLHNGRAEVFKVMGRLDEALGAYDEAARRFPRNPYTLAGRAEVLKRLGRLPEALALYDEAVRAKPDHVVSRNGRASVLRAMGRLPEALAAYNDALRLDPTNPCALAGHGEVLAGLRRRLEAEASKARAPHRPDPPDSAPPPRRDARSNSAAPRH